jgi:hypothetical protein
MTASVVLARSHTCVSLARVANGSNPTVTAGPDPFGWRRFGKGLAPAAAAPGANASPPPSAVQFPVTSPRRIAVKSWPV